MVREEQIRRAKQMRTQGLTLKVIANRLGVSEGHASKLARASLAKAVQTDRI